MSSYPKMTVVNQGLDMISESIAEGKALIFTKVEVGDGTLAQGQSIAAMTAPISPKLSVGLSSGNQQGNGQVKLRFSVDNENLNEGFFAREIAVFAKVGADGTEQLYAYTNGGNYVDYIPDKTVPIDAQIVDVYVVTGNASSVQIVVNSSAYMTIADLTDHDADENAHPYILNLIANSGLNILKRSHTYEVGDIAYSPLLKSYQRLECVEGGTTASTDIVVTSSTVGGQ